MATIDDGTGLFINPEHYGQSVQEFANKVIAQLRLRVGELEAMIREAYREGYGDLWVYLHELVFEGELELPEQFDGEGESWQESKTRAALPDTNQD